MSADTETADREAMLAEVDRCRDAADELRALLEGRGDLFLRLNAAGVDMPTIAARAGVTKAAVKQAIDRAKGIERKRYEVKR